MELSKCHPLTIISHYASNACELSKLFCVVVSYLSENFYTFIHLWDLQCVMLGMY